jgi:hypothetical protein
MPLALLVKNMILVMMMSRVTVTITTPSLSFLRLWKWEPQNGSHTGQLAEFWTGNREVIILVRGNHMYWLTFSRDVQAGEYSDCASIIPNPLHQLHITLARWNIC